MVSERAQAIMKEPKKEGKKEGFNFIALAAVGLAIGGLYGGVRRAQSLEKPLAAQFQRARAEGRGGVWSDPPPGTISAAAAAEFHASQAKITKPISDQASAAAAGKTKATRIAMERASTPLDSKMTNSMSSFDATSEGNRRSDFVLDVTSMSEDELSQCVEWYECLGLEFEQPQTLSTITDAFHDKMETVDKLEISNACLEAYEGLCKVMKRHGKKS